MRAVARLRRQQRVACCADDALDEFIAAAHTETSLGRVDGSACWTLHSQFLRKQTVNLANPSEIRVGSCYSRLKLILLLDESDSFPRVDRGSPALTQ
jgi:hypothetical protein